jgi:hypothetical protein
MTLEAVFDAQDFSNARHSYLLGLIVFSAIYAIE